MRILILLLLSFGAQAEPVHVFFAGGQSNAKPEWSQAIERTLTESGLYTRVVVVHANHHGQPIMRWLGDLYAMDFYNPEGTGTLQLAMQAIRDAGDTPIFEGLFWFQGERDAMTLTTISAYPLRFNWFFSRLSLDSGGTPKYCLAVIDAAPNQLPKGRTRQEIQAMRNVQNGLGATDPRGVAFDTRGFARRDAVHVTTEELDRVGVGMASLFMLAFPAVVMP